MDYAREYSPREKEVATFAAGGLTNRQVSTELSKIERTVANHVANILKKLGCALRVQIAAWTAEHDQLTPHPDQDLSDSSQRSDVRTLPLGSDRKNE